MCWNIITNRGCFFNMGLCAAVLSPALCNITYFLFFFFWINNSISDNIIYCSNTWWYSVLHVLFHCNLIRTELSLLLWLEVGPPYGHLCSWRCLFYWGCALKIDILACVCWLPDRHVNIMSSRVLTCGTTLPSNNLIKCKYVGWRLSQSCLICFLSRWNIWKQKSECPQFCRIISHIEYPCHSAYDAHHYKIMDTTMISLGKARIIN
jgi:hypothetical protein